MRKNDVNGYTGDEASGHHPGDSVSSHGGSMV